MNTVNMSEPSSSESPSPSPSPSLPTVEDLAVRLSRAESGLCRAESRLRTAERRLRVFGGLLVGTIVVAVTAPLVSPAAAQTYGVTLSSLATRVTALETKTASMSAITDPNTGYPTVRFTGVNVQIVNGTGATSSELADPMGITYSNSLQNGVGNLIIGYNEISQGSQSNPYSGDRTGSHNIIIGAGNSYSSFGGLIVGTFNYSGTEYASAVGGSQNQATNFWSCVSGGLGNTASGEYSSVSGGQLRTASGAYNWAAGGLTQNN